MSKLERAFQIAAEQGSSAVNLDVFSHCIIAVATEGWTEQRNPVSGRVWYENPQTGEISNDRPGADCVEPYLQRVGIRMTSVRSLAQASRAAMRLSRGVSPRLGGGSTTAGPAGPDPSTFEVEAVGGGELPPPPPARPAAVPPRAALIPRRSVENGGSLNPLADASPVPPIPQSRQGIAEARARQMSQPGHRGVDQGDWGRDPGTITLGRKESWAAAATCILSLILSVAMMIVVRRSLSSVCTCAKD